MQTLIMLNMHGTQCKAPITCLGWQVVAEQLVGTPQDEGVHQPTQLRGASLTQRCECSNSNSSSRNKPLLSNAAPPKQRFLPQF
jgi:hypothetical protein